MEASRPATPLCAILVPRHHSGTMVAAMSMTVGAGLLAQRRQAGARRAPRAMVVRAGAHTAVAPPAKGEIADKNAELAINGELCGWGADSVQGRPNASGEHIREHGGAAGPMRHPGLLE